MIVNCKAQEASTKALPIRLLNKLKGTFDKSSEWTKKCNVIQHL